MKRITFALILISVFVMGGCSDGGGNDMIDDGSDDVIKGGTLCLCVCIKRPIFKSMATRRLSSL